MIHVKEWLEELEERAKGTFWDALGGSVVEVSPGKAVVTLDIRPQHMNPMNMVHGGVLASLIDNTMGLAAMTAQPGKKVVTTNLNVQYVAPFESGTLTTVATVLHATRTTLTLQATITDGNGKLGTVGAGSFRIL